MNVTPAVEPLLGRNAKFEDLRFRCNFISPDTSYFYDVVWRINGDEVTRIIQKSADDQPVATQLLETEWKTRYRLGIYVRIYDTFSLARVHSVGISESITSDDITSFYLIYMCKLKLNELRTSFLQQFILSFFTKVQCSVRVRASEGGIPSPEHHSEEFFAGLKVCILI